MRRRTSKPTPLMPVAAAPGASRVRWWTRWRLVWVALAVLVGLGAWGVWEWVRPDPLREARAALDRRDFPAAAELLAKRLDKNPDDRDAFLLLAQTARRAGDFNRARLLLRDFERRHGLTPGAELEGRLLRAQSGNAPELNRAFTEFVAQPGAAGAPLAAEAYVEGKLRMVAPLGVGQSDGDTEEAALAAMEAAAPDLDRAIVLWLAARSGRADQVQGRLWKARVFLALNKHADGLAALHEALALDPDHYEVRYQLAQGVAQTDPESTIRHFEKLHQVRPDDQRVRFALATAYRTVGRAADSRQQLDAMLNTDPKNLSALVELGHLNLDGGNVAVAEPLLKKAHEIAPSIPETNLALARCMQLAGKPEEAANYRKRFHEIEAERRRPLLAPKK